MGRGKVAAAFFLVKAVERASWVALLAIMLLVAVVFARRQPGAVPLPEISKLGSFVLTNQFGLRVARGDLEGWVVVANVIFTRCPGQCHQLSQAMARMQSGVAKGMPVRFVSLTADPAFDTPAVLSKYAQRYGVEGERWHFLTGPKAEVYQLAVEGMKFSVVEDESAKGGNLEEQFIHSSSFAIMDRRGILRAMVQLEDPRCVDRVLELVSRLSKENWK
jgi:protein SCO1/2